jgi:hypothetical protein
MPNQVSCPRCPHNSHSGNVTRKFLDIVLSGQQSLEMFEVYRGRSKPLVTSVDLHRIGSGVVLKIFRTIEPQTPGFTTVTC